MCTTSPTTCVGDSAKFCSCHCVWRLRSRRVFNLRRLPAVGCLASRSSLISGGMLLYHAVIAIIDWTALLGVDPGQERLSDSQRSDTLTSTPGPVPGPIRCRSAFRATSAHPQCGASAASPQRTASRCLDAASTGHPLGSEAEDVVIRAHIEPHSRSATAAPCKPTIYFGPFFCCVFWPVSEKGLGRLHHRSPLARTRSIECRR